MKKQNVLVEEGATYVAKMEVGVTIVMVTEIAVVEDGGAPVTLVEYVITVTGQPAQRATLPIASFLASLKSWGATRA